MVEVLKSHSDWLWSMERGEVLCAGCDWSQRPGLMESSHDTFRAHQAAALSAAGYGLVADANREARAQALEEAADHLMRLGWNNACTAHLRARAAAERGGSNNG